MKKETFSIKKNCRLFVEHILNDKLLDARDLLKKIISESEKQREKDIIRALILEQENASAAAPDDTTATDETAVPTDTAADTAADTIVADETNLDDSSDDISGGEEGAESAEASIDNENAENTEEDDTDPNAVGDGKLDEMTTMRTKLNHQLNKNKIAMLYNRISTLKSQLNALNLNKNDMKYLEIDTKLSFYSEVLEAMQHQSMPGIDGVEQEKITEKIDIVNKALDTLQSELGSENDLGAEEETVEGNEKATTETENEEETVESTEGTEGAEGTEEETIETAAEGEGAEGAETEEEVVETEA